MLIGEAVVVGPRAQGVEQRPQGRPKRGRCAPRPQPNLPRVVWVRVNADLHEGVWVCFGRALPQRHTAVALHAISGSHRNSSAGMRNGMYVHVKSRTTST